MRITLIAIGKTEQAYLKDGLGIFLGRLKHYVQFEIKEVVLPRKLSSLSAEQVKQAETQILASIIEKASCVVLLDEKGDQYSSLEFAGFLQKRMNTGAKELVFVIGGAWGFSDEIYKNAHFKVSLSKMTFSHQMVRLFFLEQLYRAFTILKGENYHNE